MRRAALIALVLACVGAVACTSTTPDVERPSDTGKGTIVVGVSGAFAENQIVAEMYASVLEDAGYSVERQSICALARSPSPPSSRGRST